MDNYQKVAKYIDDHEQELIDMLGQFVRIPSVNEGVPNTANEGPVQEAVAEEMRKIGLSVSTVAYDEEKKRPNVFGRMKGCGKGESLLINAHSDVVPINDPEQWTVEPFCGKAFNNAVWGRGAADDKQGIASMIMAAKAIKECGIKLNGDVVLLSSVGEESNEGCTIGANPATRDMEDKPSFAIVAECTGAKDLDIEGPSLFFFDITVHGKAVHIGDRNMVIYPQPASVPSGNSYGADALKKSLPIIDFIYRKEQDMACNPGNSIIGCGGTTKIDEKGVGVFGINICKIEGGHYLGSVPAHVYMLASVLHDSSRDSEDVFNELKNEILAIASTDSWLKDNPPEITLRKDMHYWPGYKVTIDHPGVIAARKAHVKMNGFEANPTGFKATCDATYIQKNGIPAICYGGGESGHGVHGIDENITIGALNRTCKFLAGMMMEWCGIAE